MAATAALCQQSLDRQPKTCRFGHSGWVSRQDALRHAELLPSAPTWSATTALACALRGGQNEVHVNPRRPQFLTSAA